MRVSIENTKKTPLTDRPTDRPCGVRSDVRVSIFLAVHAPLDLGFRGKYANKNRRVAWMQGQSFRAVEPSNLPFNF